MQQGPKNDRKESYSGCRHAQERSAATPCYRNGGRSITWVSPAHRPFFPRRKQFGRARF